MYQKLVRGMEPRDVTKKVAGSYLDFPNDGQPLFSSGWWITIIGPKATGGKYHTMSDQLRVRRSLILDAIGHAISWDSEIECWNPGPPEPRHRAIAFELRTDRKQYYIDIAQSTKSQKYGQKARSRTFREQAPLKVMALLDVQVKAAKEGSERMETLNSLI
ncbi:hypothetical protein B0H19DRAFT_1072521 [Mycena capillaripes]|nr:hypothetical protein B0H19DRAFT_1072521 [Mycena capillaripes]